MNIQDILEAIAATYNLETCYRKRSNGEESAQYERLFKRISREVRKQERERGASWQTTKNGKTTWNIPDDEARRIIESPDLNYYVITKIFAGERILKLQEKAKMRQREFGRYLEKDWPEQKEAESDMAPVEADPHDPDNLLNKIKMERSGIKNLISSLFNFIELEGFDFDQFEKDSDELYIAETKRDMLLASGDMPEEKEVIREEFLREKLSNLINYLP